MRAVLQKVTRASVEVNGQVVGSIGRGILALVGIAATDTHDDLTYVTNKLLSLQIFQDDSDAHWKRSVTDIDGEILCVSQFTLMAATRKGSKPDFHQSMAPEDAQEMYSTFLQRLGQQYKPEKIQDGRFGAMMDVSLNNDGPVTIILDSHDTRKTSLAAEPTKSDEKAAAKAERRKEAEARTLANQQAQAKNADPA